MIKQKKKIIVVDDDSNVLNSFKFIFRNSDFNVEYVGNSNDGLNMILKGDYDIVFTDIEMPFMNGIEMISKVKIKKEINKIVFISSNIESYINDIVCFTDLYVNKPFKNTKDILSLVN